MTREALQVGLERVREEYLDDAAELDGSEGWTEVREREREREVSVN